MIKLRNLNKYFFKGKKNEIHVLNNISLTLEEKGLIAIHGASGSGKTTLLNVIGGLDKIQSGEIDFYDEYIPKYKTSVWDKIRNEYVGYIFQNYYLLPDLSVYENVRFVLKNLGLSDEKEIEHRVHYVLKALGMYPFRKKKALQLSGGQQQRVAIARALVKNPKVIIADEPTGNLDSKNTIEIMNIIKEISKETLVIMVTHEKDIAHLYANRIISLEDGKLVGDVINDDIKEHNIVDDTIYLKDIKNQENLKNDKVNMSIYYEKNINDLDVKLILKNKTLYVDVTGYDNIKLVNKSSGVVIKDEHYVKKTKEQLQHTAYNREELDHRHAKKEKGLLFSVKKSFLEAFKKFLTIGRKGKLMLFSFFVAGMIIAYSVASFASVAIIDVETYMSLPKGYVEYYKPIDSKYNLDDFKNLKGTTTDFYINPYGRNVAINYLRSDNTVGIKDSIMITDITHAHNYKLIKGRHSESVNEIVLSKGYAENFLNNTRAQDFGIWDQDGLLREKIGFADTNAKIVGIVDTEIELIFASEEFIVYNFEYYFDIGIKPIEAYEEVGLKKGSLPVNVNDILITEDYLLSNTNYDSLLEAVFPFTQEINSITYNVTGVHNLDNYYILARLEDIKNQIILSDSSGYIYSSSPKTIIENLENDLFLDGVDIYENAYETLKASRAATIFSAAITALILVGATLTGFYFVIRSSLIERIYEVAVYRALGVRKREIFSSFMVEIVAITTLTTFIGFSLMSYILMLINKGFIGTFLTFIVTPLTFLGGVLIIYLLNLLAGLLPVFLLLRKTPAQILSQYDI